MENNAITQPEPFTSAGFTNLELGTNVFRLLGIGAATFAIPQEFQKLQDIATHFNNNPDASFLIERALRKRVNPGVKPLDHIWGYVQLSKQKEAITQRAKQLDKELSFYE